VRSLGTLFQSQLHCLVLASGPVRNLADLRGRRVAIGASGSQTEFVTRRLLAGAGLERPGDIVPHSGPLGEVLPLLRDGQLEAVFWLGPAPVPAIEQVAGTRGPGLRLLPLAEPLPRLSERHGPIYQPATLTAANYPGLGGTIATIGVDSVLASVLAFDERIVSGVLTALFDNIRELPFFHFTARQLTLLTALRPTAVPLHPGAERFYRGRGVLAESVPAMGHATMPL
jgi:hypothetical protein